MLCYIVGVFAFINAFLVIFFSDNPEDFQTPVRPFNFGLVWTGPFFLEIWETLASTNAGELRTVPFYFEYM